MVAVIADGDREEYNLFDALESYGRNHVSNWLETRRVWATNELPCLPVPSLQSSERTLLRDALSTDEATLVMLERQVKEIHQEIFKKRVRLSPIRLVPPEILSRIFHYVASGKDANAFAFNSPIPPLLTVCKQWRSIGRATPSLWDAIPITTNPPVTNLQNNDVRLRAWLALSRGPLDIFQQGDLRRAIDTADWSALYETQRPWRHFTSFSRDIIEYFFLPPSPNVAHLESLNLNPLDSSVLDLPHESGNVIILPTLKRATLVGAWVPLALFRINAPQISSLSLFQCDLKATDIISLSQNFPSVRSLHLGCTEAERSTLNRREPSPPFPHLEALTWTAISGDYTLSVFQSSPRLRSIAIFSVEVNTITAAPFPNVTRVTLSWDHDILKSTISSLYTAVPQLSDLSLFNDTYDFDDPTNDDPWPSIRNILEPLLQTPLVCLNLQHLMIESFHVPDSDLLKRVSRFRSGGDIGLPDASDAHSSGESKTTPGFLHIRMVSCRGPPDVGLANYEELCEALDEYVYLSDEVADE